MKAIESLTESWLVIYLLNSIWQAPLIFAAAWIAARLTRSSGPQAEHRIWVGALFVQAILPACDFNSSSLAALLQQASALIAWLRHGSPTTGETHITIGPALVSSAGLLRLSPTLLTAIAALYGSSLLYFTARLIWGLHRTAVMRRTAESLILSGDLATKFNQHNNRLRPPRFNRTQGKSEISLAISPIISGPVTVGARRSVLLLPPGFLENANEADLDAVLAHEFAHIQRQDFARNLIYNILSLPVAYHPALWLTQSRLAESREMICDEIAARTVSGREKYARSLLRLASMLSERMPTQTLHAIGIFDANIFERRVMSLTNKRTKISSIRRLTIAAACAVITAAACTSALAFHMNVSAAQSQSPKSIHVRFDVLKLLTHVDPIYPADAAKDTPDGSVVLAVHISKDGIPEQIRVEKGPREFQRSALDAVRQWRWESYLLNGNPIEVDTTVTVAFSKPH
jgi:TonB family protein